MSELVADKLGSKDPSFVDAISLVESKTSNTNTDLVNEETQLAHVKIGVELDKQRKSDNDINESEAATPANDEESDNEGINLSSLSSGALSDAFPGAEEDEDAIKLASRIGFKDAFSPDEVTALMEELRLIGMVKFVEKYVDEQHVPIVKLLYALGLPLPFDTTNMPEQSLLPVLKVAISRVLRRRRKLPHINTIYDAVELINKSNKIMILTGAGVSVSCGIPDFRSENGIYSKLGEYNLDDPQQMFDIEFFRESPEIFYSFIKELFPSNFKPSISHHFIRLIEEKGKLLRNYTQNIDTLEQSAGITQVLQCHGSFSTASCIRCGYKVPGEMIKDDIFAQRVPKCVKCLNGLAQSIPTKRKRRNASDDNDIDDDDITQTCIVKPDIVFFGEKLSDDFDQKLFQDREEVDLLIIMGTSLKVAPVSEILGHVPPHVPQILINRTPIVHMGEFDVQLLGESDTIVQELCRRLGWDLRHKVIPISQPLLDNDIVYETIEPNVHLFQGAVWKGHGVSVDNSEFSGSDHVESEVEDGKEEIEAVID